MQGGTRNKIMTGEVTIDTIDIWTQYGAFIVKGGFDDLLKPARRKASLTNNWPEQNGVEIDLTAPRYEAKDADVTFIISASSESAWWARYNAFVSQLQQAGERSLYIKELSKTFAVYYKEAVDYSQLTRIKGTSKVAAKVTIKFGIANPA